MTGRTLELGGENLRERVLRLQRVVQILSFEDEAVDLPAPRQSLESFLAQGTCRIEEDAERPSELALELASKGVDVRGRQFLPPLRFQQEITVAIRQEEVELLTRALDVPLRAQPLDGEQLVDDAFELPPPPLKALLVGLLPLIQLLQFLELAQEFFLCLPHPRTPPSSLLLT